jgi:hypothetical protein
MAGRSLEAPWVASVRSTAQLLEGELCRISKTDAPDYKVAAESIRTARELADRPDLVCKKRGPFNLVHRTWHRFGSWWTGREVDEAWAALHNAGEALLEIESDENVRSQVGDMAAAIVTTLTVDDLRARDYMATLGQVAQPANAVTPAERSQLRAIRHACNSTTDGAHADARAYRNTLVLVGSLLSLVLVIVGIITLFDTGFRSVFASGEVGRWYVVELELVASLSGLTAAILSLKSYVGFQYTYGLPFVQAFLKATTGAATGLFGVLLVQAGIISFVKTQSGGSIFAVAVIFGAAQYLFTRLVDQQANQVLKSASSHNDPGTVPKRPAGSTTSLVTTVATPTSPATPSGSPGPGSTNGLHPSGSPDEPPPPGSPVEPPPSDQHV